MQLFWRKKRLVALHVDYDFGVRPEYFVCLAAAVGAAAV